MQKSIIHTIILGILTSLLISSCSKESSEEKKNPDSIEETADYVFSENFNNTEAWNSVILGKNGLSYFYKSKDGIWDRFAIFDYQKKNLLIYAEFDEYNKPAYIVTGEYTYVFDNFDNNKFDLAVTFNNEVVCIINNIPLKGQLNQLLKNNIPARSSSALDDARKVNAVIAGIGCAASSALAVVSGGLNIPLAYISCTSALVSIVDACCDGCCPPWLTTLSTIIGCTDGIGCTVSTLQTRMLASAATIDKKNIQIAQNALSIEVTAELKEVTVDYCKILLPVIHTLKPGSLEQTDFEIGIFYGTNPDLPESDRIREKDEKLNWLTLSNGDCIGSIELKKLKPNTKYYYMPYLVYNKAIAYGEIKSFTTADIYTGRHISEGNKKVICTGTIYSYRQKPDEYGVCYSTTNINPTLQDTYILYSSNIEMNSEYEYSAVISDVSLYTTYYYRAYMKIGNKIYYGETKSFTIKEEEETDIGKLVGTWIPAQSIWWWEEKNEKGEKEKSYGDITAIIDKLILNNDGTCNSSYIFGNWDIMGNVLLIRYHFYDSYAQNPTEPESVLPLDILSLSKNEWTGNFEDIDEERHEYVEIKFIRKE